MTVLSPHIENIKKAAHALQNGSIVAFPTETVYGLGANANDGRAVAKIYDVKDRPQFNPLITHVKDLETAISLADFSRSALKLAKTLWPGPVSLVLPQKHKTKISELVTAGLDTIALRIPDNPIALQLLHEANCPIAAPSANISGRVSPTLASHVAQDFKNTELIILDGGASTCGLESTILHIQDGTYSVLRPGMITQEEIQGIIGDISCNSTPSPALSKETLLSPGQLKSHYAPKAALRLNATKFFPDEAVLAFGHNTISNHITTKFNLSPNGDLHEAAANLFKGLRYLDSLDVKKIAVMPIPNVGLGVAINDRLARAAA
ncbi:MAG: L-threonylcarbamoyladenylate synthase [Pseudomonadota bacterium]